MSKKIVFQDCWGNVHTFKGSLFRGVHLVEAQDGFCVLEKRLFRSPETIACFSNKCDTGRSVDYDKEDCRICSFINPTQRLYI